MGGAAEREQRVGNARSKDGARALTKLGRGGQKCHDLWPSERTPSSHKGSQSLCLGGLSVGGGWGVALISKERTLAAPFIFLWTGQGGRGRLGRISSYACRVEEASRASHVEASRMEASQVEASRVKASRVKAAQVDASRGEASRVEASHVEACSGKSTWSTEEEPALSASGRHSS